MSAPARKHARNYFWPLLALGAVAAAQLIGTLITFARQSDQAVQRREQAVVENGLRARMAEIGQLVVTEAVWDEAVRHLDNSFDKDWAHDNIGEFFNVTDGFEFAYVVDRDDAALYGMEQGRDVAPAKYKKTIAPATANLIAKVRADEAERAKTKRLSPDISSTPIQASAMKLLDGRLFVLTATLVQPDFGKSKISGPRAPVIVTGDEIDQPFINEFANRYLLDRAHLHEAGAKLEPDQAHVGIRDETGAYIATLDWAPQRPGAILLKALAPWSIAIMIGLGLLFHALSRRVQRATQSLMESEARATHIALHDVMTGIPNRAKVEQRLTLAAAQLRKGGEAFAVHCIDLDRFKELNDTYGHLVGDELLRAAANRLKEACGPGDLCARLGGDEFAIIQSPATRASAESLAAHLVEAMGMPFDLSVGAKQIGCSIGVAMAEEYASEPMEYLRQADLALYQAKENGRGAYCLFASEMDLAMRTRRLLQEDLRKALDAGELSMVYQPQVNKFGKILGLEALARWTHAEHGPISPSVFVPLAEECGLIVPLGEFTLRRVFEDSRQWPDMKIAINVSATQIQTNDFVARVEDIIAKTDADPKRFELELTEGVLVDDDDRTRKTLNELRALGFSLALDDFGTGYSSLSYLQRFPISKIKIDRSFVTNLGADGESGEVIAAIVKLARALNLSVIAEGVETPEQWLRVQESGCTEIQGFVASKPVGPESITDLLISGAVHKRADGARADVQPMTGAVASPSAA
jgi:diguanylate cyclase (GGDEF)-like protein